MPKIKHITIHAGHNKQGKIACGASDYIDESTEARIITKKVINLLSKKGIKATNCTVNNGTSQNDVLRKIVAKCNALNRDVDVSIHFNALRHSSADGKTKGVEVLVKNLTGIRGDIGKRICKKISNIGFTNRGVKVTDNLYFLNRTNAPAILIEVCFVDDYDDAKLYKKNKDEVAKAIANAIVTYSNS